MRDRCWLIVLPAPSWAQGTTLGDLARDALGCERRLKKEVDVEADGYRYTLLCRRIQRVAWAAPGLRIAVSPAAAAAAIADGAPTAISVGGAYLAATRATGARGGRLTAVFFPPAELAAQAPRASELLATDEEAVRRRAELAERAVDANAGLVEVCTPHAAPLCEPLGQPSSAEAVVTPPPTPISLGAQGASTTFGSERKRSDVDAVVRRMSDCVISGSPFPLGSLSNDVLTEALRVIALGTSSAERAWLRVMYEDGTEGEPLQIGALPWIVKPDMSQDLAASLMSMRHTQQDTVVDLAWFRNREVSRGRASADTERWCRARTHLLLEDLLTGGKTALEIHPNGFAPAIVGFFVGVLDALASHRGHLIVTPAYYRGSAPVELGTPWF